MMQNIGIVGRKRSGKDTAAAALVEKLGYVRHGFADPLKDAALALNPSSSVPTGTTGPQMACSPSLTGSRRPWRRSAGRS